MPTDGALVSAANTIHCKAGCISTLLTNVVGVQVLAKVRQTRPRQDEEVDLVDEPSLLRRSIEGVPKDFSNASLQWLLLLCEWAFGRCLFGLRLWQSFCFHSGGVLVGRHDGRCKPGTLSPRLRPINLFSTVKSMDTQSKCIISYSQGKIQ